MLTNLEARQRAARTRRSWTLLAIALTLALLGVSAHESVAKPGARDDASLLSQREILELLEDDPAPGVVLGVSGANGCSFVAGAGVADLSTGREMRADTPLFIASITKPIVAALAMKLVEQGRLSLDAPFGRYHAFSHGEAVTVRQLLSHTSGIPDYLELLYEEDDASLRRLVDAPASQSDLLEFVREASLEFTPGEGSEYSNSNYLLLGLVIEAVEEQPLATSLEASVFTPLGMAQTSLFVRGGAPADLARGYGESMEDLEWLPEVGGVIDQTAIDMTGDGLADGNVITTAADLLRFARGLHEGALLSPASAEQMRAVVADDYGLGVAVFDERTWGHAGGMMGYSTLWVHDASLDLDVVVLLNHEDGDPEPFVEALLEAARTRGCGAR